ncbi:MAG: hypothetical protein JRG91_19255 [Deltaproteobacteria bacterium]|nr:hypothetical protein [Deltaproteobacteria bacterium]
MTRLLTVFLLLLGLTVSAPAQAGKGSLLEDERLYGVKTDLAALFERVDEAGLPGPLFEAKVREGLVKKVLPKKILGALGKLEKVCLEAKKLLVASGLKASPASIGSVAQVLSLGVAKQDVARLLAGLADAKAGPGVVAKSLLVVVMMSEGGTKGTAAVDQVLAIVVSAGEKGLDDWIGKNVKSAKKGGGQSKKKKAKGKSGKKKHKAKGKAPGKSHGK